MGLFNKLKEILFDEETIEIPVITKEDKRDETRDRNSASNKENSKTSLDDEVVIKKIETPKRSTKSTEFIKNEEDLFDMPKLKADPPKEIKVEPTEPKRAPKTFTFPVFEDDEPKENLEPKKRERRSASSVDVEEPRRVKEPSTPRKPSGYTNAYDYSYGKYKGDYKSYRESNQAVLKTTLETKEDRKAFTPSPIISPVYGVLNENYKKEDIVSKSEKKSSSSRVLDLDSVRRKAYGTLEDEIELSLTKSEEIFVEKEPEEMSGYLEEGGISINDLLVDSDDQDVVEEAEIDEVKDEELFDILEKEMIEDEIEIDETDERKPELDESPKEEKIIERKQLRTSRSYSDEVRDEVKLEKTEDTKEPLGEEDLFDLIDSLYQGKGEE